MWMQLLLNDGVLMKNLSEIKCEIVRELDIDFMENAETEISVKSEDDARHVLSMALQARKMEKTLEKSRTEIIKPHLDYQRAVNKLVKDFREKICNIEEKLQKKVNTWVQEQNENPFTRVDELKVDDGTLYVKRKWDFRITDERIIPREYLHVDVSAIEDDIKRGVRNIPGVEIFQTEELAMRTKN